MSFFFFCFDSLLKKRLVDLDCLDLGFWYRGTGRQFQGLIPGYFLPCPPTLPKGSFSPTSRVGPHPGQGIPYRRSTHPRGLLWTRRRLWITPLVQDGRGIGRRSWAGAYRASRRATCPTGRRRTVNEDDYWVEILAPVTGAKSHKSVGAKSVETFSLVLCVLWKVLRSEDLLE